GAEWDINNPLQIWVAADTYLPLYHAEDGKYDTDGGRDNAFVLIPYVQVYGGFAGGEENLADRDWNTNKTILSGDIGDPGDDSDNSHHVVIGTGDAMDEHTVLDGFTITGGYANETGPIQVNEESISRSYGGGISISDAAPTLRNLVITGNKSTVMG